MGKRYRSKASEDEEKENRLKKRLERLEDAILRRGKEKHQKKKHSKLCDILRCYYCFRQGATSDVDDLEKM